MFARQPTDVCAAGSPNGSAHHVMPDGTAAVAAADGVVWSATQTARGYAVVIDHAPLAKVATFYTHLEKLLVAPTANAKTGERVRAGQPIGIIGADPLDAEHLKHLHFELWRGGPSDAVDPAAIMRAWSVVPDPNALARRNGSFVYRPIGASGDAYPEWVRALRDKAGVSRHPRPRQPRDRLRRIECGATLRDVDAAFSAVAPLQRLLAWPVRRRPRPGVDLRPCVRRGRRTHHVAERSVRRRDAPDPTRLAPRDNLLGQPPAVEEHVPF